MKFYTSYTTPRPVRLPETTRQFAWDSLNHKYGLDTMADFAVSLADLGDLSSIPQIDLYDLAIERIVRQCRIRICDGERLSGAATLGMAITHNVPVSNAEGKPAIPGISHLTTDFGTVLRRGIRGIREDVNLALQKHTEPDRIRFLESCSHVLDCFEIWHGRYLDALRDKEGYEANYRNLCRVPMEPATNFYEAVQSVWFTFAFQRLCGVWPGIGRIDEMLGEYLKKDLADGTLTPDDARDILAHFLIKGCEWICGGDCGSGDAQHYQNLVISGIDADGRDVTNEVTYLLLDVLEELPIGDFPTTVRLNKNTDEKLLRRVAEVMRYGGGVLAVYNEDVIIPSMVGYGYPLREARKFANDGCWEVQVPGKTYFIYRPFDGLEILQKTTLADYGEDVDFADFESLYQAFVRDLDVWLTDWLGKKMKMFTEPAGGVPSGDWHWKNDLPCTVPSLFEGGCVERGLSYLEGGPIYEVFSPHIGGFPDLLNSLYAIKKLVFDDKLVSFRELMRILRGNWEGEEPLRQTARNRYRYFGNDNDEIDLLGRRVLGDFARLCRGIDGKCGFSFPAGVSTFGRQIDWAPHRLATPSGYFAHEILAPNCSPTPGSDWEGATAIIRSYCKLEPGQMVTGAALDLRLLPSDVEGENGLDALCALLRGFVTLGGCFMQPDVADPAILRAAQEHPEDYQTLSVRVSGWNARFVTLNRTWQEMVILNAEGKKK